MKERLSVTCVLVAFLVLAIPCLHCGAKPQTPQESNLAPLPDESQAPVEPEGLAAKKLIKEYDFEKGIDDWTPVKESTKLERSSAVKHSGEASMKISGTVPSKVWNIARSGSYDLEPGKQYRLTAWVLVESIGNPDFPPKLKSELWQGGNFSSNATTEGYKLEKKGEWQELQIVFKAPEGPSPKEIFSVEKGTFEESWDVVMFVDDIKLELVE